MIEWNDVDHFQKGEFPENPDLYAEPSLIYMLDDFRALLNLPIYPSPANGALARFDGNPDSRHYAVDRKSDAVDIFVDGDIRHVWLTAMMSGLWGGVGVYFDTYYLSIKWPMLHLDLRPLTSLNSVTYWFRDGDYYHPMSNNDHRQRLFQLLSEQ